MKICPFSGKECLKPKEILILFEGKIDTICDSCNPIKTSPISKLFEALNKIKLPIDPNKKIDEIHCPKCKMTYNNFRKSGKIGCENCYSVFHKELSYIINGYHKNSKHIGKIPKSIRKIKEIEKLNILLKECVKVENYEKAIEYRDEIKKLNLVLDQF